MRINIYDVSIICARVFSDDSDKTTGQSRRRVAAGARRQKPHHAGAAATRLHNSPLWKQSAERRAPTKGRGYLFKGKSENVFRTLVMLIPLSSRSSESISVKIRGSDYADRELRQIEAAKRVGLAQNRDKAKEYNLA